MVYFPFSSCSYGSYCHSQCHFIFMFFGSDVVSQHSILTGGFGSYLLAMDERTYQLIGVDYPGNRAEDVLNPGLGWMIGFLFVVSFLGLFSLVPLRKVFANFYFSHCCEPLYGCFRWISLNMSKSCVSLNSQDKWFFLWNSNNFSIIWDYDFYFFI